ncbi:hypothetical protein L798_01710 [Zootermopsis nevadensis]|uniref:Uncharacterized protein n=1 Tax=Zootermopsis nevadensis TaxID=136037 RepID=A0A067RCG2_ZOONE|nr:hypothetical protein L798_01710 [Zootermopsis nevadensis]
MDNINALKYLGYGTVHLAQCCSLAGSGSICLVLLPLQQHLFLAHRSVKSPPHMHYKPLDVH